MSSLIEAIREAALKDWVDEKAVEKAINKALELSTKFSTAPDLGYTKPN